MRYRIPAYIPLMALVTAAYLTVEIPFSVRLVEVMGGNPSPDDVDRLEGFGRVLTGVAAAIWLVGSFVLPRLHARGFGFFLSLVLSAAIGSASVYGTYLVLDAVAHETGRGSAGTERKEAFIAGMARRQLAERGLGDVTPTASNDWNTFVAVMPEIAGSSALVAATGMSPERLAEEEAARSVGSVEAMRKEVFGAGFAAIRRSYERYEEGSREYLEARSGLKAQADKAYDQLTAEVIRKYGRLPRQGWDNASIVREVRKRGIDVDQWWVVSDRRGFTGPYMKAVAKRIEDKYRRAVESALGEGAALKPGLGFDAFASHPGVQKQIRARLGLPASGPAIVPSMSAESFRAEVHQPKLDDARRNLLRAVAAPAKAFENGGEFAFLGTDAVKASRLPAMAILLSIAGAALHIFKFSGYAAQILAAIAGIGLARGAARHVWGTAATAAAFAAMVASGNAVTGSASYSEVRSEGIWQSLLEGAISIQPAFSDAGRLLGDFGGWQAFAADMPAPSRPSAAVARPAAKAVTMASAAGDAAFAELPDGGLIPLPSPAPRP